jgi:predicted ATP-grasp superfamily ATP-dependent carboligase
MIDAGALVIGGDYRALGVVRSLGRRGIPVWVLQQDDTLAGYSRFARRRLRWPDASETEQTNFLLGLADAYRLDGWVLFPTTEETAWLVSCNHRALSARFRLTTSPWCNYVVAADKRRAYSRAELLGIDIPRTWYVESPADVAALDLPFPVILKPALRITHNRFTDEKAWRIENRQELLAGYEEACTLLPAPYVMIQEVIDGGGEHQLAFAAACLDGEVVAFVTARRRRQYPVDFGRASTFVETIDRPDIVERSMRLLADLRLNGLVEIEYKQDARDGRVKLLDVNARAWGWHSIGKAAGVDFPYVAWRLACNDAVTRAQGRGGVRWVRLAIDLPVAAREIAAGRAQLGAYVRSLRPPMEGPIAALDDCVPALMDVPILVRRALKRRRRRTARPAPVMTKFGAAVGTQRAAAWEWPPRKLRAITPVFLRASWRQLTVRTEGRADGDSSAKGVGGNDRTGRRRLRILGVEARTRAHGHSGRCSNNR